MERSQIQELPLLWYLTLETGPITMFAVADPPITQPASEQRLHSAQLNYSTGAKVVPQVELMCGQGTF